MRTKEDIEREVGDKVSGEITAHGREEALLIGRVLKELGYSYKQMYAPGQVTFIYYVNP